MSLSKDERKELFVEWSNVTTMYFPNLKVITHVGMDCVNDARELSEYSINLNNVVAVGAMPPSYFKPASIDALVATMKYIADGCPNLPFYYYHIPSMTNVIFPMLDFVIAAENIIDNLAGIKYTGLYQK